MISLAIIPEYSSLKTGKTGKIMFFLLSCHFGKGNLVCMVLKAMVHVYMYIYDIKWNYLKE